MLLGLRGGEHASPWVHVARPERNKRDEELGNEKPKIWICDECLAVNDMDYKKCIECDASKLMHHLLRFRL